jgi:CRISPR/Cas system CSM-associated protein Csm4 (group 5 of RAMP superfamily)
MTPEQVDKLKYNFESYYRLYLDAMKLVKSQSKELVKQQVFINSLIDERKQMIPLDMINTHTKVSNSRISELEEQLALAQRQLAKCQIKQVAQRISLYA